jgi:hypothetical protein
VYTNVPTLSTTAYAVRRAYLPHLIHMYELHDAWPVPIDWMWGMNTSTVLWKQHVPLFEDPVGRCLANVPEERMPSLPVSSSISHTVAYADRVQALLQDPRFRKPLLFTCRIKNFSDKSSMFSSVQQTVTDLNQQTLQSRDWLAVLFVNDEYTFRPSCPNADRLLMIYGMLLNVPIWADHIALVPLDDINDFIRYLLSGGSFESYKWHRSPFRFFTTTAQSSSM